jgi:hypothetical protein
MFHITALFLAKVFTSSLGKYVGLMEQSFNLVGNINQVILKAMNSKVES